MRFPENLQRFALCCTLCCTDVVLRCTETPQFLLHRCPMQGLVPPDRCATNPVQRKAPGGHPSIGRRPLRGSIFGYGNTTWFWCRGVGPPWYFPPTEESAAFHSSCTALLLFTGYAQLLATERQPPLAPDLQFWLSSSVCCAFVIGFLS